MGREMPSSNDGVSCTSLRGWTVGMHHDSYFPARFYSPFFYFPTLFYSLYFLFSLLIFLSQRSTPQLSLPGPAADSSHHLDTPGVAGSRPLQEAAPSSADSGAASAALLSIAPHSLSAPSQALPSPALSSGVAATRGRAAVGGALATATTDGVISRKVATSTAVSIPEDEDKYARRPANAWFAQLVGYANRNRREGEGE